MMLSYPLNPLSPTEWPPTPFHMKTGILKFNFGVVMDLVLIAFAYSLAHIPDRVIPSAFVLCFAAAAPLQVGALCNMELLPKDFKPSWLPPWETLILILAVGGFVWLFVPALVLDSRLGWNIMRVAFFVALFGGVGTVALVGPLADEPPKWVHGVWAQRVLRIGAVGYLCVSEFLLYQTAHFYPGKVGGGVIVITVIMSYAPVRWLMIRKRPFSLLEVASSVAAFVWFMHKVLSV